MIKRCQINLPSKISELHETYRTSVPSNLHCLRFPCFRIVFPFCVYVPFRYYRFPIRVFFIYPLLCDKYIRDISFRSLALTSDDI